MPSRIKAWLPRNCSLVQILARWFSIGGTDTENIESSWYGLNPQAMVRISSIEGNVPCFCSDSAKAGARGVDTVERPKQAAHIRHLEYFLYQPLHSAQRCYAAASVGGFGHLHK